MYESLDPNTIKVTHAADPILERETHSYGFVQVYPPAGDPSTWKDQSWRLVTEKSFDGAGLDVELKASSIYECYLRPHFIREVDKFSKKKA